MTNGKRVRVVAFAGASGAGKDEAVRGLKISGRPFSGKGSWIRMRFADPIKRAVGEVFEGLSDDMEWAKDRELPYVRGSATVRDLLKVWGCAARDQITPYIWADLWEADARVMLEAQPESVVVVPDLRFVEEVWAVKALGGVVFQIDRVSNIDGSQFAPDRSHVSERGIPADLIDVRIRNNGVNVEDFHGSVSAQVRAVVKAGA